MSTEDWDDFARTYQWEKGALEKCGFDWDRLSGIREAFISSIPLYQDSCEAFQRIAGRFNGVHSVRARVKDPDHLVDKIIRKRSQEPSVPSWRETDQTLHLV